MVSSNTKKSSNSYGYAAQYSGKKKSSAETPGELVKKRSYSVSNLFRKSSASKKTPSQPIPSATHVASH